MRKIKIINADKEFVSWMRQKYPDVHDPERTRRILSEVQTSSILGKKLEEILYGKKKKKKK